MVNDIVATFKSGKLYQRFLIVLILIGLGCLIVYFVTFEKAPQIVRDVEEVILLSE